MRVVADASTIIDAILDGPRRDGALRALNGTEVWVPQHVDAEVMSAIARLERGGSITTSEADQAIARWRQMPVERMESSALLAQAWLMRASVRTSDAIYVALAILLACPLVTSDARLSRAPITGVTVTLIR